MQEFLFYQLFMKSSELCSSPQFRHSTILPKATYTPGGHRCEPTYDNDERLCQYCISLSECRKSTSCTLHEREGDLMQSLRAVGYDTGGWGRDNCRGEREENDCLNNCEGENAIQPTLMTLDTAKVCVAGKQLLWFRKDWWLYYHVIEVAAMVVGVPLSVEIHKLSLQKFMWYVTLDQKKRALHHNNWMKIHFSCITKISVSTKCRITAADLFRHPSPSYYFPWDDELDM